ncbi:MAG TPA: S8 family serine peptidase [Steroidobacteraceae bacterium]|nr:S8 family serine peptidase [Steroidobacteraceae bacterium]
MITTIKARLARGSLAAFAVIAFIPISAMAQSTERHVLKRATGTVAARTPLSQRPQTVVLKMTGDPVAVVRARMPGHQLAEAQRRSIEGDLRARQDAITPSIRKMGGRVLGQFQHALNGIKVRGTPDQIRSFATLPGVIAVRPVRTYHLVNAESVPFIGAPQVWQGPPGLHGEHVRIAVIDTGVDYTHANFGGPGTVAAFKAASATSTQPADPTLFGPDAPKVKGGTDLVGDAYNADDPTSVPMPDPNPLDCNGHGSHTSGTATGFGVTAGGTTFKGSYDASTPGQSFIIGPGVAPLADLYAVRVFGCTGSTNVVVDAIDWAVAHDMQVISMSLGADFGTEDDADSEASENAVNAGIIVVASAGNAGPAPYLTGDPSTGEKAISVAAMDSHQSFPAEALALAPAGGITAEDSNGITAANGTSLPVVTLLDASGNISLGCDPAEYRAAGVTGKLVVTRRGSCARVARAIFGQQAGAAAVAMINNAPGYPPFEGPINSNPDTGVAFTVTIPFLGVQGSTVTNTDGATLAASSGATLTATTLPNPTFRRFASFTSAGPREGDGHLKPDISAPGVSIFSTAVGTGNQGLFESGTSMAAPHVAGSAALAVQAHPQWSATDVSDAIVNTADATKLIGYSARLGGNGLVQPLGATETSVFAHDEGGVPSVSFGVAEFTRDFTGQERFTVENRGESPASFALSVVQGPGAPHAITVSPTSLTLSGNERRTVQMQLSVPLATVGDSSAFREVQGRVVLTPTSGNNGVRLSVPYYLVPRARSLVSAHLSGNDDSPSIRVDNRSSAMTGTADFYAWGLRGNPARGSATALRAVGVQSFNDPNLGQILVFAVNTFGRSSNPATTVYDLLVDVNGDGTPDYDIEAADLGTLTTGTINGQLVVAVFNLATGGGVLEFFATAPTDGTTILMPVVAADAGITGANPRFSYVAQTTDLLTGNVDAITTPARFNAFSNAISTGAFVTLPPGTSASVPVVIDHREFRQTPALGQMVVSLDNATRDDDQALLLHVGKD